MTSKELFLQNLVKDNSLVNCKYGRINKDMIYEIGESKEYIYGYKEYRVTVLVKDSDSESYSDSELTKTFSEFGHGGNKEKAYEYVEELKSRY